MKRYIQKLIRYYSIYCELGYRPWHKPRKQRKAEKKKEKGVYMGAKESIPFMNDDAKRTISNLLFRPGYMMRDYIMRGQHERYLAPITALIVFYSVLSLVLAIVNPKESRERFVDQMIQHDGIDVKIHADSLDITSATLTYLYDALVLMNLDAYPDKADTPWKQSLAAIEGDLRSKGIPLFIGSFLLFWLIFSLHLRKYKISVSGAAAMSAFLLCQFCIFMFFKLLITFGGKADLSFWFMMLLVFIDYLQLFRLGFKKSLWLTVKTALAYSLYLIVFTLLVGIILVAMAYNHVV
ncbi:MAG: DUF3667 domain-containing protein [Bacteroidales bacterium]|nr:DUF3667 domain-containing protein [Bacteroidales bacterium]